MNSCCFCDCRGFNSSRCHAGMFSLNYNNYVINISAPAGTDVKALKPTFTLFADNEKVYIDDQEQISGESVVDFTNPVTYRFVTTSTVNPEITVESTCVVTINK